MTARKSKRGAPEGSDQDNRSWLQETIVPVAALVALLASTLYHYRHFFLLPTELRPLDAPKLTDLAEFSDADYKNRMLWGSYRPGLYFGMRTRTPTSLISGLLWFDPDSFETLSEHKVRHTANEGDGLRTYGWVRHDGSTFGRKTFVDEDYNITLSMVKSISPESGTGGDWAVRISSTKAKLSEAEALHLEMKAQQSGVKRPRGGRKRISLVMYLGDEAVPTQPWQVMPDGEPEDLVSGPVTLAAGVNSHIGPWSFHVREDNPADASPSKKKQSAAASRLDYLAQPFDKAHNYLVHVKEYMLSIMYDHLEKNPSGSEFNLYLPNGVTTGSNMALFQVTISLPGTVDFVFLSHPKGSDPLSNSAERVEALRGKALTKLLAQREKEFDERFKRTFPAVSAPASSLSTANGGLATEEVAKVALSTMLGSVGYSYGSTRVRVTDPKAGSAPIYARNWWTKLRSPAKRPAKPTDDEEEFEEEPFRGPEMVSVDIRPYMSAPLLSVVPCHGGSPHGSLWDEGFHQLLLGQWDSRLSRDVIAHWLDLMNAEGWIPRHQFLGYESTIRVADEDSIQSPKEGHPPSLMLPFKEVAQQLAAQQLLASERGEGLQPEDEAALAFLAAAVPRLEALYHWYNRTRSGQLPGSYRWHGRHVSHSPIMELNPTTEDSGMDDYPRASHPSAEERHVDLRCWMALASEAMVAVGEVLGKGEKWLAPYRSTLASLSDVQVLDKLHLDVESGQYRDWGLHTEAVSLNRANVQSAIHQRKESYQRVISGTPVLQFLPFFGYNSLFPLISRVFPPDAPQLANQLRMLSDPQLLWSPYGIRSLSPSSSMYKAFNSDFSMPAWRGHIALNINYLVLQALDHYRSVEGPQQEVAADLYTRLRETLLRALAESYRIHGHLCGFYDDETAECYGRSPFGGWAALVALIAQQP